MGIVNSYKEKMKLDLSLELNSLKSALIEKAKIQASVDYFFNILAGQSNSINRIIQIYQEEYYELTRGNRTEPAIGSQNNKNTWYNAIKSEINNFPNPGTSDTIDSGNFNYNLWGGGTWTRNNGLQQDNAGPSVSINQIITETVKYVHTSGEPPETTTYYNYYHYHTVTEGYGNFTIPWKLDWSKKVVQSVKSTRDFVEDAQPGTQQRDDYYINTDWDEFIDANRSSHLAGLLSTLNSLNTYVSILTNAQTFLNNISSDLNDFGLTSNPDGGLNALISNLQGHIGSSGDTGASNTFNGFYNYFSTFNGEDANYNTYLNNFISKISALESALSGRSSTVNSILGGNSASSGLNNYRYLVLETLIGDATSYFFGLIGTETAISNSQSKINFLNAKLIQNGVPANQRLITPEILATYYNPKFRKDNGEFERSRIGFVVNTPRHTTKITVFRREITEANKSIFFNNNDWTGNILNFPIMNMTETDENGFIELEGNDEEIDFGKLYIYRVTCSDENGYGLGIPSFFSQQSNLFEPDQYVEFNQIVDGVIELQEPNSNFKTDTFVLIRTNLPNEKEGFYRISIVDETRIFLEDFNLSLRTSGKIYFPKCVVKSAPAKRIVRTVPPESIDPPEQVEGIPDFNQSEYVSLGVLKHEWLGTRLRVMDGNGIWGQYVNLQGPAARRIIRQEDPTLQDDSRGTAGNGSFFVGDFWINELSNEVFMILNDTENAARWVLVSSGESDGLQKTIQIATSATTTSIDSVLVSGARILKWLVYIQDNQTVDVRTRASEVLLINKDDETSEYSEYGILGDDLNVNVFADIIGPFAVLRIFNNEDVPLTVRVGRLTLD